MKKITLILCLFVASFSMNAQNALTSFTELCTACSSNSADFAAKGCRVVTGLCDIVSDDSNIAIKKESNQVKNVIFAFDSQEMMYASSAKVEILNRKGEVIHTTEAGNMFFMNQEGNIYKSLSTLSQDANSRNVAKGDLVLFSFPMEVNYEKRDKLKVKVSIMKMNTTNRGMEVVKTYKQRL